MKKYFWLKFIVLALFLGVSNQSCTDLEEELFEQVTPDRFFQSDEEFIAALGAAYTSLYGYGGNGNIYSLQEVTSDEMVVPTRGNDWNDGGHWRRLHTHQYNSEDDIIGGGWSFLFGGINTCNRLIFQFTELQAPGSEAFIAELKALRALYYLWAMDTYGNVPIVTDFNVPEGFTPDQNTRAQVYAFVESELTSGLANLSQAVDGTTYGRMNYYAAQAALAKLYLNAEVYTGTAQWQKAIDACDAILNSGKYSLTANYRDNFVTDNGNSKELILAIPYDQVFARGFNLPMMTLHYGSQGTYNLTAQPWNGFCSLEEFYNSYDDADARKANNFVVGPQKNSDGTPVLDNGFDDPDGAELNFTPKINELGPQAHRQAGARVGKFEFKNGATDNLSNDFPIFRLADIMLMKAEALVRLNKAGDALALVNPLRARAGVPEYSAADLTLDELLAERGREMFSEVYRRSDLIRFGKYNSAWWEKPVSDPSKNIFPIPRGQLDANKKLKQNPGY